MTFVPLHVHSQFSILDSTASVKGLAKQAKDFGINALALTDFCNMYGAVDFFKACSQEGIKPIVGCEIVVAPSSRLEKQRIGGRSGGHPIILLAKDKVGYKNLCKLSSMGFTEGFYYTPRIDKEVLKDHASGLICLVGSHSSLAFKFAAEGNDEKLSEELSFYQDLFKEDFYIELQRFVSSEEDLTSDGVVNESWYYQMYLDFVEKQKKVEEKFLSFAEKNNIKCVATNDVHYLQREDWSAHEILMNVQSGEATEIVEKDDFGNVKGRSLNPKRKVKITHEHYFKSPEQMAEIFKDIPESLKTTQEIADKCHFEFDFKTKYYPVFVPPSLENQEYSEEQREEEASQYLRLLCEEGIPKRYTEDRLAKIKEKFPEDDPNTIVRDRLELELEIIISKGLCDYLLIVHDFIAWSKNNNIPVGPGRGSGAGSIILYLIGITDIEPLRFGLFFERFINPERISYPDIDVDICMSRRSEVIDYTINKYGREKVAQIITFGTMKAKMAIKDVGRVLSVPLAKVNAIAKLIPDDLSITLEKALEVDKDFLEMYNSDEEAKRVIDLGKKVEGSIRNTGIHAAGIIVCGVPLTEHIPVCTAKDSEMLATQYSMKPVESVGMLKMDFLGLKTLTSIQKTVDAIKYSKNTEIDWVNLPLEDEKTFELLNHGNTQGVFQLESSGMQDLAKNLHIDKFEEILAVGALYRPGPMEMIPSFINRKHGREKIEYDHPFLKEILSETYGIMVYQEQVMQIASKLAKYSLGEGDLLRKAMGKKDREEMARQKVKFLKGAAENNINEKVAATIFDKIEKFASYGFNKSHATAYGFLSYVTAFLKANYTGEWLAALMSCDIDDISKVSKHIRECQAMNIEILAPDVNESGIEFVAIGNGIRFALSAIKGVGRGVVEEILLERAKNGLFKSIYDFIKRIDHKKVGKKVIETLIRAGCFDFTKWTRSQLLASFEAMFEVTQRLQKEKKQGVMDLFSSDEKSFDDQKFNTPPDVGETRSMLETLREEKELLGFFLTAHPMDLYKDNIEKVESMTFEEVKDLNDKDVCILSFVIDTVQVRISKTQRKFAILTISDGQDRFEVPIWPDLFEKYGYLLEENHALYGVFQIDKENDEVALRARSLSDLTEVGDEDLIELKKEFDSAVQFMKSLQKKKNNKAKSMDDPATKKIEAEKKLRLKVKLNADQITLAKLLEIKKVFLSNPGHISVDLQFLTEDEAFIGQVIVQPEWGVRLENSFENQLRSIAAVRGVHLIHLE